MTLRLIINCASCGFLFGLWQNSIYAAGFVFLLLGFFLSVVDYWREGK